MEFQVYQSTGKDAEHWRTLINKLSFEKRDIHYLPEYASIYQKTYQYEPYLAYYREQNEFIIQPFVKRNLNQLPFLQGQESGEPKYDIANAYGFGGPLSSSSDLDCSIKLGQKFNNCFRQYCFNEKIASEFAVCHPLLGNYQLAEALGLKTLYQKAVVYLDLTMSEVQLWQGLRNGHQRKINQARKSGVMIEKVDPTTENLQIFDRLYRQTMQRNNAEDRWSFPIEYFQSYYDLLGAECCSLFFAIIKDQVASASIFMHDFTTIYYHFGASDSQFFKYGPNILLMYSVALWAKEKGYRRFHLGGGVTVNPDDSLLHYKVGFSNTTAPLYIYYRIHHQDTYELLSQLKKNYERTVLGAELNSDYFPLYRR